jgi:general stress protein CsbA
MNAFKFFLLREVILVIAIVIVSLIVFQTILKSYYIPEFWMLLAIIAVLTGFFHYSQLQIQDKQGSKFTNRFMMSSGIKMMVYLALITSYSFLNPSKAASFLISFFVLYILFTAFEIIHIVNYIKKKQ